MELEFDVTKPPPEKSDIAAVVVESKTKREALRRLNKRFLVFVIILVLAVLSFVLFVAAPAVGKPDSNQDLVFVVTYFLPYLFFIIFIVGNHLHIRKVEKPRKALNALLASLEDVSEEELARCMEEWSAHEPVMAYLRQVEAQGRPLVKAEQEAIQRWIKAHAAERQAA